MRFEDLPDPSDREAVITFAASFDGYKHFGSFGAAAEVSNSMRRETLIALRN